MGRYHPYSSLDYPLFCPYLETLSLSTSDPKTAEPHQNKYQIKIKKKFRTHLIATVHQLTLTHQHPSYPPLVLTEEKFSLPRMYLILPCPPRILLIHLFLFFHSFTTILFLHILPLYLIYPFWSKFSFPAPKHRADASPVRTQIPHTDRETLFTHFALVFFNQSYIFFPYTSGIQRRNHKKNILIWTK